MIINTIKGITYVDDISIQGIELIADGDGTYGFIIYTAENVISGMITFAEYAHVVQKIDQMQADRTNLVRKHREMILGDEDDETN